MADQAQLLKAMQEQFAAQMQQLQSIKQQGAVMSDQPASPMMIELPQQQSLAVPEFEPTPRPRTPPQLKGAVPTSLEEAIAYIQKLEDGANSAIVKQLREVEKRATHLASRVLELETELKTYQDYMKTTVLEYKKKLQTLQGQLSSGTKGIKGGGPKPGESTALPPLK